MGELSFATAWETVADALGDNLAVRHGDRSLNWTEFEDRAARVARALGDVGVAQGDNVALALFNSNEYVEAEFAAFKLRAAPVNVNYRYVDQELSYLVDNSDAKAVFFDASLVDRFDRVRSQLPDVRLWVQVNVPGFEAEVPDWAVGYDALVAQSDPAPRIARSGDDLWILYTGGTTGHPKGVMWPHKNVMALANRVLEPVGLSMPETVKGLQDLLAIVASLEMFPRQLAASPLMHGTSGITKLSALTFGGAVVTLTDRKFNAKELWDTATAAKVTTVTIVGDVFCNPMLDALDEAKAAGHPYDLASLQDVMSSGVMWSQPVKDRLLAHARESGSEMRCTDSLGASEGVGFGSRTSMGDGDTETAVFELGPKAALFTVDGRRVEPGSDESGMLAVTGPIPIGYYGDPEKTATTFREFEGTTWSVPGDWATLNADGTLNLLGRGSVSINTGGEKVFPEEVEEALKLLPEVADAYVVGVPDPKWGAAVTAVVEPVDGAEIATSALSDRLRESLASYKLPKNVVVVEQLLRSPNGKADYRWAARTAREHLGIED